ncbi:glycoside hydrolase family 3 C-terminal domain-containing protein [Novosphingobium sp. 1949]|uniref:Glycoside hydrolase family 3 C-terminal domain-containing protein n=1 Tax=Novosphingobium organovorum TaxID=2930092 RepID=A0ABT0BE85_9SPHN|nr:glycoside hydrolase family 3 C-terminal domain-containing protein [Novosphingobium organovorum]MCJ2183365.1 glycoside hydrolase family 3 C-terminal domain-containing protein [Novosphingobium organovorum]
MARFFPKASLATLLAASALTSVAVQAETPAAAPAGETIAAPVRAAVAKATLEQKAAQLQSTAPADPAMGLPAYDWWSEGLHGLARNGIATVFPQAIGLAATWDPALLEKVGTVVSTEARAKFNAAPLGADRRIYEGLTIWSPNINIFRDPRWGRGQETYGEDPFLTGSLAVGFIDGLQGPDRAHPRVIATAKHLAVHSGPEAGRDSFDVDVAPQDLEATYLPAFRMAVTKGRVLSLMCSYNSIHGTPVCADAPLIEQRVRGDWGFDGFVVSDCDAIGNIWQFHHFAYDPAEAAAAGIRGGTDFNCGTAYGALPQAVKRGLVSEEAVDTALERSLQARYALGTIYGASDPWGSISPSQINTPADRALALEAARKSIVLAKNDGAVLPLKAGTRLAVIGVDADDLGVLEGNYHGTAAHPVTPLDGLRARFGAGNVTYAQGALLAEGAPVVVPETALSSEQQPGLVAHYADGEGHRVLSRQERRIDFNFTRTAPPGLDPKRFTADWVGAFTPPAAGDYTLVLDAPQCWKDCTRHDDVELVVGANVLHKGPLGGQRVSVTIHSDGRPQPIRLHLDHYGEDEGLRLMWVPPAGVLEAGAMAAADKADVIVAVLGLSPDLEGEALQVQVPGFVGGDRSEIELPEPQARLLAALRATGKPVVAVLSTGSAVAMDPAQADAVLVNWYSGEEGGTALADTLAGVSNPSGRLPVTFYRKTGDLPAFVDYSMKERTYRYFTGAPLWGFGHGLSYTTFAYSGAKATAGAIGAPVTLMLDLANTGARAGEEVVQAYVVPPSDGHHPILTEAVLQRQLGAFTRVALKPGQKRKVTLTLDPRQLSVVDRRGTRRVLPGDYKVWIGGGQPGDGAGQWVGFTLTGQATELPK